MKHEMLKTLFKCLIGVSGVATIAIGALVYHHLCAVQEFEKAVAMQIDLDAKCERTSDSNSESKHKIEVETAVTLQKYFESESNIDESLRSEIIALQSTSRDAVQMSAVSMLASNTSFSITLNAQELPEIRTRILRISQAHLTKSIGELKNLLMLFSASLAFTFITTYAYRHQFISRPIIEMASEPGKPVKTKWFISSKRLSTNHVRVLKEKLSALTEVQSKSEAFISEIGRGNLDASFPLSEKSDFASALLSMRDKLKALSKEEKTNSWINNNVAAIEKLLKSEENEAVMWQKVSAVIATGMSGCVSVLYEYVSTNEEQYFVPLGSYGRSAKNINEKVFVGQGQLGELGLKRERIVLNNLPSTYVTIESALGASSAKSIAILPLIFKDGLYGAIEVASFHEIQPGHLQMLERTSESIAAHLFNLGINRETQVKLQVLAKKQADELVEVRALQEETNRTLKQKLREVEEEKQKNEAILEGCVDGVLSFDESGVIHFCNVAMADICKQAKDQIIQRNVVDLFPIKIIKGEKKVVYGKEEKQISVRTEASFSTPDNDTVDVLITSTYVALAGKVIFTFFVQKISVDLF